jgi:hypothetical protein
VVDHFDRRFALGLSREDQADLIAYLTAVGDGLQPYERDSVILRLAEIMDFASVLSTAIPAHDTAVITLVTDTVGSELRELTEKIPAPKDTNVSGGSEHRRIARAALKDLVLCLRRVDLASAAGRFDEAANEYVRFRKQIAAVPVPLQNAEPWSLFDPTVHDAHYTALRQMYELANAPRADQKPSPVPPRQHPTYYPVAADNTVEPPTRDVKGDEEDVRQRWR